MKKLALSLLTLLECGILQALPVGNPTEASLFRNGIFWEPSGCCDPCDPGFSFYKALSFRAGYYGNFVYNRNLNAGNRSHSRSHGRVLQKAEINTDALYLAFNVCNRADIFATLGSSDIRLLTNENVFTDVQGNNESLEQEYGFSPRFSWSIGARATIWECNCFGLGVAAQYFHFRPNLDYLVEYEEGEKFNFDHVRSHFRECQVSIGVSYRIATSCPTVAFIPYAAVKWARVNWEFDAIVEDKKIADFFSHKRWGYAMGLSFTFCEVTGVTVEGRFGDEKALYVNGQVRF